MFTIFTPVVLQAPGLVSPVGATTIDSLSPRFVVQNSARSGPAGQVSYLIELSTTDSFSPVLAAWVFDEQPNQSALNAPVGLSYSSTYFWRARAFESTASSAFSAPQAFKTPAAPSVPTGGGSGGSGGSTPTNCSTPAGADGINMNQAVIENSPVDLASWCVGAKITNITFLANSFRVEFSRRDGGNRWPDFVPPGWGWSAAIHTRHVSADQRTLVVLGGGRVLVSAQPRRISSAMGDFTRLVLRRSLGTLAGKQPATGEQVPGIFVCAGDCRNKTVSDPGSLKETIEHPDRSVVQQRWTELFLPTDQEVHVFHPHAVSPVVVAALLLFSACRFQRGSGTTGVSPSSTTVTTSTPTPSSPTQPSPRRPTLLARGRRRFAPTQALSPSTCGNPTWAISTDSDHRQRNLLRDVCGISYP